MAVSGRTRVEPLSERSWGMSVSIPPFWQGGYPLAEGLGAVLEYGAIRQGERFICYPLVIGVPGRIRIKAMDDWSDEREPELSHGSCV